MFPALLSGTLRTFPLASCDGEWLSGVVALVPSALTKAVFPALLSGTLRTLQVASCDGERLQLQCPAGTTVSIHLVQYGRLATKPFLCGSPTDLRRFNFTDCMDRRALKVRHETRDEEYVDQFLG